MQTYTASPPPLLNTLSPAVACSTSEMPSAEATLSTFTSPMVTVRRFTPLFELQHALKLLPLPVACHLPLEEMRDFHLKHDAVCTMMGVKVSKEASTKYGCVVMDEQTQRARHYVEKPSEFISNTINGGFYLFDGKAIFDELKLASDRKAELSTS